MHRHQARGHTGAVLDDADHGLGDDDGDDGGQPAQHPGRCRDGQQPRTEADQKAQVGDQQAGVQVGQGDDLDLQARDRAFDALVPGVRAGAGHQRARHQGGGQGEGTQKRQLPQRLRRGGAGGAVVGLADPDEQQGGHPHHRHRRQQVDGDGMDSRPVEVQVAVIA